MTELGLGDQGAGGRSTRHLPVRAESHHSYVLWGVAQPAVKRPEVVLVRVVFVAFPPSQEPELGAVSSK